MRRFWPFGQNFDYNFRNYKLSELSTILEMGCFADFFFQTQSERLLPFFFGSIWIAWVSQSWHHQKLKPNMIKRDKNQQPHQKRPILVWSEKRSEKRREKKEKSPGKEWEYANTTAKWYKWIVATKSKHFLLLSTNTSMTYAVEISAKKKANTLAREKKGLSISILVGSNRLAKEITVDCEKREKTLIETDKENQ